MIGCICLGVGEILAIVALLLASLIGLVPIKCKCKCKHENSIEV
jgi:hypothetical protein